MITKTDIVNKFNEIFVSTKTYKDLSEYEKLYALLVLSGESTGSSGSTTSNVTVRDKTVSTNQLTIDTNGQIGINNLAVLGTKLDALLAELDSKASLTDTQPVSASQNGTWNLANITGTISLPTGAASDSVLQNVRDRLPTDLVNDRFATTTLTESVSQQFLTADDRVVTTNYSDTTKTTQTSVTFTSASVTTLTGKTQLTITFSNPTTTSDRVTYSIT